MTTFKTKTKGTIDICTLGLMFLVFVMALAAGAVLLSGCAGMGPLKNVPPPPSICDNTQPEDSLLCALAHKYGVRLEDVGNIMVLFNVAAIEQNAYSAAQSRQFFNNLRTVLAADGITGQNIMVYVLRSLKGSPALVAAGILVVSPYIQYLDTQEVFTATDKTWLNKWIDDQLALISQTG